MQGLLSFTRNKEKLILLLILSISIIAPLNNDIFISSFPSINIIFKTEHAQWLLSIGLICIAFAQLFSGAFMDKLGRKPIILIGLLIFSSSSIGVVFSGHFNLILIFRALQSIGASCSIVGAVAIAKDSVPKEKLVYYTSFIFGIVSISPFLAPTVGSYLQTAFGWQGSFSLLFSIGIIYFLVFSLFFKESIKEKDTTHLKNLIFSYFKLLKNHEYIYYIAINCMSYIFIFIFISTSPIIIIYKLGFSVIEFGYIFLLFSFVLLAMNIISPKLATRIGFKKLMCFAGGLLLLGMIIFLILNMFKTSLLSFMLPMIIAGVGCGIIRPTASTAVMQLFPAQIAGKTIALYNFMFYVMAGVATLFSSILITGSLIPLGLFLLLTAIIAVAASVKLQKL